jgi:Protein of unknown function (DUF4038)/Domain of unknown function (DUF5060)/Putative collagen-binding domain of a collagenase
MILLSLFQAGAAGKPSVAKWAPFEQSFESAKEYDNPIQEAELNAVFVSPTGQQFLTHGFWDGGKTWRLRFAPNQTGTWTWETTCTDPSNAGLNGQKGEVGVTAPAGTTRFQLHGPIQISHDLRYFEHEDHTPFFWLADTAWNGPLLSTEDDWNYYTAERARQKFDAVQWVATQWRAAPTGDLNGNKAFSGREKIEIHPEFFQRLDHKINALNQAGLLSVPVMLWAIAGGSNPRVNPGYFLSEDQAMLLAKYMAARWGAYDVAWILAGDGDYRGAKAERWKNIGRAVFGNIHHAPVTLHPGGMQWIWNEFREEKWYDFVGYQSGHGDDAATWRWIQEGPLTEDWMKLPHLPFINLEPPYEGHLAYQSKQPLSATNVRNAIYWCLLDAPTAGTSYGGHGVWGWDNGTKPPTDHAASGTPLPWQKAIHMEGAEQMAHVIDFFTSIDFWRLRPAPIIVVNQPGKADPKRYVAAARTDQKDLAVAYIPQERTVEIKLDALPPSPNISWINPRSGEKSPAVAVVTANTVQFPTPSEGDWILLMQTEEKPAKPEVKSEVKPAAKPEGK